MAKHSKAKHHGKYAYYSGIAAHKPCCWYFADNLVSLVHKDIPDILAFSITALYHKAS